MQQVLRNKSRVKWKEVAQLCLTLCDLMDYTVHGILQARILEWVAFPFSRGPSQPRDRTQVSHIAGRRFTIWATREIHQGSQQAQSEGGCFSKDCCPPKTLQDSCDVDRVEEEGAFWTLGTADGILGVVQPEGLRMIYYSLACRIT